MKEAVVNEPRPEPLDVRIDHASDTVRENDSSDLVDGSVMSCVQGEKGGSTSPRLSPVPTPLTHFSPFCAVDQMKISVHCHVKSVKQMVRLTPKLIHNVCQCVLHNIYICMYFSGLIPILTHTATRMNELLGVPVS